MINNFKIFCNIKRYPIKKIIIMGYFLIPKVNKLI